MPHECLQRPGVDTSPRKGIASAVAQHVDVDGKRHSLPGRATSEVNLYRPTNYAAIVQAAALRRSFARS
jgi:hypothetical protein